MYYLILRFKNLILIPRNKYLEYKNWMYKLIFNTSHTSHKYFSLKRVILRNIIAFKYTWTMENNCCERIIILLIL